MTENIINAAIQLLPAGNKKQAWEIIDKAIELISSSGLNYTVCPFETVIEGKFDEVVSLVKRIRDLCYENGAAQIIINLKLQFEKNEDIFISGKMKKYDKSWSKDS